ncbi:hypothetical protein [Hymenobacter norwichensis]|uniref:hypothetical protein n=1 Tax=Hymenobacter norwichensis TaxID=223903 RepID=UPI0003B3695B|nr:hypothetical protein [Hymenobacter norwichensis]
MNTLDELSSQEEKIYEVVESLKGTMEAKEQWLDEAGVFNQYATLHRKYLELLKQTKDASTQLETLKRLVFINWYMLTEPAVFTGINELDHAVIVASYQWLNQYIIEEKLDKEFYWMLSYYSCWDYAILMFSEPDMVALTDFVKSVDTDVLHVPKKQLPVGIMNSRGQMGHYWKSCSVEIE